MVKKSTVLLGGTGRGGGGSGSSTDSTLIPRPAPISDESDGRVAYLPVSSRSASLPPSGPLSQLQRTSDVLSLARENLQKEKSLLMATFKSISNSQQSAPSSTSISRPSPTVISNALVTADGNVSNIDDRMTLADVKILAEQCQDFERRLKEKDFETSELQSRISSLSSIITKQKNKEESFNADITLARLEIKTLQKELFDSSQHSREERSNLVHDITQLTGEMQSVAGIASDLNSMKVQYEKLLNELKKDKDIEVGRLLSINSEYELELMLLKEKVSHLTEQNSVYDNERRESFAEISSLKQALHETKDDLRSSTLKLSDTERVFNQLKLDYESNLSVKGSVDEECEVLKNESRDLRLKHQQLIQNMDSIESAYRSAKRDSDLLKQRHLDDMVRNDAALAALRQTVTELLHDLSSLRSRCSHSDANFGILQTNFNDLSTQSERTFSLIQYLENDSSTCCDGLRTVQQNQLKMEDSAWQNISTLNEAIHDIQRNADDEIKALKLEHVDECKHLVSIIKERDDVISALDSQVGSALVALQQWKEEVDGLRNTILKRLQDNDLHATSIYENSEKHSIEDTLMSPSSSSLYFIPDTAKHENQQYEVCPCSWSSKFSELTSHQSVQVQSITHLQRCGMQFRKSLKQLETKIESLSIRRNDRIAEVERILASDEDCKRDMRATEGMLKHFKQKLSQSESLNLKLKEENSTLQLTLAGVRQEISDMNSENTTVRQIQSKNENAMKQLMEEYSSRKLEYDNMTEEIELLRIGKLLVSDQVHAMEDMLMNPYNTSSFTFKSSNESLNSSDAVDDSLAHRLAALESAFITASTQSRHVISTLESALEDTQNQMKTILQQNETLEQTLLVTRDDLVNYEEEIRVSAWLRDQMIDLRRKISSLESGIEERDMHIERVNAEAKQRRQQHSRVLTDLESQFLVIQCRLESVVRERTFFQEKLIVLEEVVNSAQSDVATERAWRQTSQIMLVQHNDTLSSYGLRLTTLWDRVLDCQAALIPFAKYAGASAVDAERLTEELSLRQDDIATLIGELMNEVAVWRSTIAGVVDRVKIVQQMSDSLAATRNDIEQKLIGVYKSRDESVNLINNAISSSVSLDNGAVALSLNILQTSSRDLYNEFNSIKNTQLSTTEDILKIQGALARLVDHVAELRASTIRFRDMDTETRGLATRIEDQLEAMRRQLFEEREASAKALASLQEELDICQRDCQNYHQQCQVLTDAGENIQSQWTEDRNKLEKLKGELHSTKTLLESVTSDLDVAETLSRQQSARANDFDKECNDLTSQIVDLTDIASKVQHELCICKDALTEAKLRLEFTEEEKDLLKHNLDEALSQLKRAHGDIHHLSSVNNQLGELCKDRGDIMSIAQSALDELNLQIVSLQRSQQRRVQDIDSMMKQCHRYNDNVTHTAATLRNASNTRADFAAGLGTIAHTVHALGDQAASLQSFCNLMNSKESSLKQMLFQLDQRFTSIVSQMNSLKMAVTGAMDVANDFEAQAQRSNAAQQTLSSVLRHLAEDMDKQQQINNETISEMRSLLGEASSCLNELGREISVDSALLESELLVSFSIMEEVASVVFQACVRRGDSPLKIKESNDSNIGFNHLRNVGQLTSRLRQLITITRDRCSGGVIFSSKNNISSNNNDEVDEFVTLDSLSRRLAKCLASREALEHDMIVVKRKLTGDEHTLSVIYHKVQTLTNSYNALQSRVNEDIKDIKSGRVDRATAAAVIAMGGRYDSSGGSSPIDEKRVSDVEASLLQLTNHLTEECSKLQKRVDELSLSREALARRLELTTSKIPSAIIPAVVEVSGAIGMLRKQVESDQKAISALKSMIDREAPLNDQKVSYLVDQLSITTQRWRKAENEIERLKDQVASLKKSKVVSEFSENAIDLLYQLEKRQNDLHLYIEELRNDRSELTQALSVVASSAIPTFHHEIRGYGQSLRLQQLTLDRAMSEQSLLSQRLKSLSEAMTAADTPSSITSAASTPAWLLRSPIDSETVSSPVVLRAVDPLPPPTGSNWWTNDQEKAALTGYRDEPNIESSSPQLERVLSRQRAISTEKVGYGVGGPQRTPWD